MGKREIEEEEGRGETGEERVEKMWIREIEEEEGEWKREDRGGHREEGTRGTGKKKVKVEKRRKKIEKKR